jgi:hypothetical protein
LQRWAPHEPQNTSKFTSNDGIARKCSRFCSRLVA